ncbi:C40 family peptidase [Amorphoplanes digitatis]|uniref:Cell wall-associated NlpC family hydrolase n=1 Tax=Actinoplanes digitatis TaxID=1868 RepID=A0A7W7I5U3_9ACTN|nr:C40 family peptidase [Actinoplanes digitatis]MBB4767020.1 cell wall-associated NlpC family hydrolase [Actinoplanes digitatis]
MTNWQYGRGGSRRPRPWWRPLAYSAATAAAIAMLFNPLPASAAPVAPPAVPDAGSRPLPLGTLTMPGQTSTGPATTTPIVSTGVAMTPLLAKVEKGRDELATLGEKLTRTKEDFDLATQQLATADQKVAQTAVSLAAAREEAADAAAAAVRDAAAMPPGTLGSGLEDLDSLARINRGDSATEQAAGRQLAIAQDANTAALSEQQSVRAHLDLVTVDRDKLQAEVNKKSAAQQKLEQQHADEVRAADAAAAARDAQAGAGYLSGENAGRGADPRAIAALTFALAQRGDPYVWSEEGPDQYDCSGLMYAAYRSDAAGNFPLTRVSKDQYYQTRAKVVDRYSLLPGDLLFFSSTSSWTGIHHVAMYAGDGMMVEAPRTGLNVRLTPVRWTRLFGATRIYGSVEGTVEGPVLGNPDPETPSDNPTTTKPPTTPPTTKPTTKPPTTPPTTKPTTKPTTTPPSTQPTTPSTPPTNPDPTETQSAAPSPSGSTAGSSDSSPSKSGDTSSSSSASASAASKSAAAPSSAATNSASASASSDGD